MNHKSVLMTLLILLPAAASGAEIINKDGNKLDLYGQLNGVHYFSSDADNNGDRSYTRFGFKGETQIGDALTGYGQWEYQAGLDQPESADRATAIPAWALPDWRSATGAAWITAATTACCMTWPAGRTCCLNSATTATKRPTTL